MMPASERQGRSEVEIPMQTTVDADRADIQMLRCQIVAVTGHLKTSSCCSVAIMQPPLRRLGRLGQRLH